MTPPAAPLPLRSRALAGLLALAALLPGARGETSVDVAMEPASLASIRFTALSETGAYPGFYPVRVRIENRAAAARTWDVEFSVSSPGGGNSARFLATHRLAAGPATTQEAVLYLPVPFESFSAYRTGAVVSGEVEGPEVARAAFTFSMGGGPGVVGQRVAAGPAVKAAFARAIEEAKVKAAAAAPPPAATSGARLPGRRVVTARDGFSGADPARWPADWRTWSMFEAVVLSTAEWELLDAAPRRALQDWVAMGGRLWLVTPGAVARRESESRGLGSVVRYHGPLPELTLGATLVEGAAPAWRAAPRLVDPADPDFQFRPAGRWLMFFLVGFALTVGPLNLFWFARAGRRHRLFVTTPVISLAGAVLLAGAAVWGDGLGGVGVRQALVVLQPAENQAAVLQQQVARTGLLLHRAFDLPADTVLVRVADEGVRAARAELLRTGDRAEGDWFSSRNLQRQELRRLVPTRARLEVVGGGDGRPPVLQSSLGTVLRGVWYVDAAGQAWTTAELPPGRRITLEPADRLKAAPPLSLGPAPLGWFWAEGGTGELAPLPTLEAIRWKETRVWFAGPVVTPEAAP